MIQLVCDKCGNRFVQNTTTRTSSVIQCPCGGYARVPEDKDDRIKFLRRIRKHARAMTRK